MAAFLSYSSVFPDTGSSAIFEIRLLAFPLCLLAAPWAHGTISSVPIPRGSEVLNWMNIGVSVGAIMPRDASFWGATIDYSRVLSERWSITTSLAFDQETERFSNKPDERVDTYTFLVTGNYAINERWAVSSGLARGLLDDNNPQGKLKLNWGDLSTGISAAYAITHRLGLSIAWEYNLTQSEPSFSMDIGYRWGF